MEEKVKALETVVQSLCDELEKVKQAFKTHIRSHIAEYEMIDVISMKGITENGISYTWGNYYRAPVNQRREVQSE